MGGPCLSLWLLGRSGCATSSITSSSRKVLRRKFFEEGASAGLASTASWFRISNEDADADAADLNIAHLY